MQTDETDLALMALLGENARLPVATLARKLGLARTTVQARLDRLESSGVIQGYSLRLGSSARPPLRATVLVSIEPRSAPRCWRASNPCPRCAACTPRPAGSI